MYGFVRPHSRRLVFILLLSLISTLIGLAQPYITKYLIDDGLIGRNFDLLLKLSLLMVAVGLVVAGLGAINRWHYVDVSARILLALRESVFSHLLRLSPRYYARTPGGELIARLDGDVGEVQRFAVDTLLAVINGVFALTGAVILMLSLSWQLSLLALALIPLIVLFLKYMRPLVERMTRTMRERASDITSFFVEKLAAVKFIQSAGGEPRERGRLADLHEVFRTDLLRLQMTNYVTGTVPALLTSITTAAVFVIGGYLTIQGQMTVGTLIAFSAYMMRATGPVHTLLGLYVAWQRARVSLQRVSEIRDIGPEVVETPAPVKLPEDDGADIRFENVIFGYAEDEPVLKDVNFSLPAGARVALHGPSGIGKSTIVDLLHRHYDPISGTVLLAGHDIRNLWLRELRSRVAVVAQDTVLFDASILENVRYANPGASDNEVHDAIDRARVGEFAQGFKDGLTTRVGVRGTALSGGQRQRIAIARALLQHPMVLILDEATSGVDRDTERRIVRSIDELFPGCTRLTITHRPDETERYDFVLKIQDDGTIAISTFQ